MYRSLITSLSSRLPQLLPRAFIPAAPRASSSLAVEALRRALAEALAQTRAAEARADAASAALTVEEKRHWFTALISMASSSARTSSSCEDELRRGAPPPETASVEDVLRGFSAAASEAMRWAAACAPIASVKLPVHLNENRDVHPIIGHVLRAILGGTRSPLRLWHDERAAPDDFNKAHMEPDFVLTDVRDSMPSTFGALIIVEVKPPGAIKNAAKQVRAFMRQRVSQLCREADARGEAMDGLTVFGVATDGKQVVIVRMGSGAPAPGGCFKSAVPCSVKETPPLPLFPDWTPPSPPAPLEAAAPEGFRALLRLCGAPRLLGGGGALSELQMVPWENGKPPPAWCAVAETLVFDERLGTGGTSDVYSCGGARATLVAKAVRYFSGRVLEEFAAERAALAALRDAAAAGLVPEVVAHGGRPPPVLSNSRETVAAAPWPVLLLRTRGMPLEAWVAARVDAARGAPDAPGGPCAAAAVTRIACADAVVLRVLDALCAAHGAGWAHCDVRPSNIVSVNGRAMLVDWGTARRLGQPLKWRGVPAYADSRIFTARGVAALPHIDALGALYSWLSIAHSVSCVAPWLLSEVDFDCDEDMHEARSEWVRGCLDGAAAGLRVAAVARAIGELERMEGRRASEGALALARSCVGAARREP